jgi:inorganic triphosphatase YgiF
MPTVAVKRSLERELKLDPGPEFALESLDGEAKETRVFTSVYHDSADRSLARLGITLRRRTENGRSAWQLKLPRDNGRLEIEAPGPPAAPPAEIAELLRAALLGRALESVAELRTQRSVLIVQGPKGSVAEVVVDAVDVMDGRGVSDSFSEVEIELLSGADAALRKLGKRIAKAGAAPGDGRPKVFRAMSLEDPREAPGRGERPFALLLGQMLRRQVD